MADRPILNPTSPAVFAGAPYGDAMEVSGPPEFVSFPLPFRPFFFTDARSVLVVLAPRNVNMIHNPSFRNGLSGWSASGLATALDDEDSWVGQSVSATGTGTLRPVRDGHYVYVGPERVEGTGTTARLSAAEHRSSEDGWMLSAFFKGTGRYRLSMRAYSVDTGLGEDAPLSPPANLSAPQVDDPGSAPYNAAEPVVVDNTGIVWRLREPPFYTSVGRCPRIADPGSLTAPMPDRYVLDTATVPGLWAAITPVPGAGPYYERLGATQTVDVDAAGDPALLPPTNQNYLRSTSGDPSLTDLVWIKDPGPWYVSTGSGLAIATVAGPWVDADPDEWTRAFLRTGTLFGAGEGFNYAWWIDARIEVEDASDLKVSSVMLGRHERDTPPYFDGGMTEATGRDDFIWRDPGRPNASPSEYYPDRAVRTRWLYEYLPLLVPVKRPVQIYYGDYSRPYVPDGVFGLPDANRIRNLLV